MRWLQRFQNFERALLQLESAVELSRQRGLSELESRHLATMLGELEETPIPQKVDLMLKKTLRHQELLDHSERVGVVFYDREMVRA
jgi:hypothetical protein